MSGLSRTLLRDHSLPNNNIFLYQAGEIHKLPAIKSVDTRIVLENSNIAFTLGGVHSRRFYSTVLFPVQVQVSQFVRNK